MFPVAIRHSSSLLSGVFIVNLTYEVGDNDNVSGPILPSSDNRARPEDIKHGKSKEFSKIDSVHLYYLSWLNGLGYLSEQHRKRLPWTMRSYHDVFEGERKLYYKKGDTISGIESTILHEFREMIESVFATVVLLPKEEFLGASL